MYIKKQLPVFLFFVSCFSLYADSMWLTKDINPTPLGSNPEYYYTHNGFCYFHAVDVTKASGLWVTDGTESGTVMTKIMTDWEFPEYYAVFNGQLYFLTRYLYNSRLFKITSPFQEPVEIIKVGLSDSLVSTDQSLFFVNGSQLWVSNGTAAGTHAVSASNLYSYPQPESLVPSEEACFFFAYNTNNERSLWKSDGTNAGTIEVCNPDSIRYGYPRNLFYNNQQLYFFVEFSDTGIGLYRYDDNTGITSLLTVLPESEYEVRDFMNAVGDTVLFYQASSLGIAEIWSTRGTVENTVLLKTLEASLFEPARYPVFNGAVYFSGRQGTQNWSLWKSNGTPAGTVPATKMGTTEFSYIERPVSNGQYLLFNGYFNSDEACLMRYDEISGVQLVLTGSNASNLTAFDDQFIYTGNDSQFAQEPWITNATTAGTHILKDINPATMGSDIGKGTVYNNRLYFSAAASSDNYQLWQSDGTQSGTKVVEETLPPEFTVQYRADVNNDYTAIYKNVLYYNHYTSAAGEELWRSDGTTQGTWLVKDINPSGHSSPFSFGEYNGLLYFRANDGIHGAELWQTDGTAAGTKMVADINSSGNSSPMCLTVVNGKMFFWAADAHGQELWITDGTAAGTRLVKDINPSGNSYPHWLTALDTKLIFAANEPVHGEELWISDGTESGTHLLKDIYPTNSLSYGPFGLKRFQDKVYFEANDNVHGQELWATDGTEAGTYMVKDINPGGSAGVSNLTVVSNKLYFIAYSPATGRHIWTTDGTEAGTIPLDAEFPQETGSFYNYIRYFIPVGNSFFIVFDETPLHGRELWIYKHDTADFNDDGISNLPDFQTLSRNWLRSDCNTSNFWCQGADSSQYGQVDVEDLLRFIEDWL